jgi:HSP20 family molecular chaperone IbpA
MAERDTTKAGTKGESRQQSPAAPSSQPELEAKLSAEQDAGERTHEGPVFVPRVDIYESETGLVVVADLPGVSPEGLEITLEKRVLSIYGRVGEDAPEGYSQAYREYEVGDFERQFTLSGDFDINGIEANLKYGVLHLSIPRAPEAASKRIEVKSNS